eukprot:CAMPEP_0174728974 /NCGR_PEP_ID=MMETSP1094-20130205/52782_1 /TAXON_ID=156173 /ORGANISM="Chrysochromulina brevifilum, Strain UTEX LB 985" /LENGTH=115 /DNA_ID=CAMNT_0015930997 /DNA_START=415 /DNA_END=762 /DNA_ORIENTATION=-
MCAGAKFEGVRGAPRRLAGFGLKDQVAMLVQNLEGSNVPRVALYQRVGNIVAIGEVHSAHCVLWRHTSLRASQVQVSRLAQLLRSAWRSAQWVGCTLREEALLPQFVACERDVEG